jgi:ABC-type multidrug transport system ATPase subunit
MRENFEDATVILLATRFRMIVQCDRVIVMNHGKVVEFDTPLGLLDDPKSKFSLMLAQTGDVDPVMLRALAKSRADSKSGPRSKGKEPATTTSFRHASGLPTPQRENSHSAGESVQSSTNSLPASLHNLFQS